MDAWKIVPVELTSAMKIAARSQVELALTVGPPEYDITDGVEMAWQAALSSAPTPPEVEPVVGIKPYGWGIVDKDGKITRHPFDTKDAVKALVGSMNRNAPHRGYRVVQLFYKEGE